MLEEWRELARTRAKAARKANPTGDFFEHALWLKQTYNAPGASLLPSKKKSVQKEGRSTDSCARKPRVWKPPWVTGARQMKSPTATRTWHRPPQCRHRHRHRRCGIIGICTDDGITCEEKELQPQADVRGFSTVKQIDLQSESRLHGVAYAPPKAALVARLVAHYTTNVHARQSMEATTTTTSTTSTRNATTATSTTSTTAAASSTTAASTSPSVLSGADSPEEKEKHNSVYLRSLTEAAASETTAAHFPIRAQRGRQRRRRRETQLGIWKQQHRQQ